jgi:hypothetical protein
VNIVIIRPEQMAVFELVKLPDFENYMVAHLMDFTLLHSRAIGEEGIRAIIRSGVERSKTYGLTRKGPVRLFIEMVFLLGVDFDTDPQFPWIRTTLEDPRAGDENSRADLLHERLMDYVNAAGGPGREYSRRSLVRARRLPFTALAEAGAPTDEELLRGMRDAYPEKFEYVGEQRLRPLIRRAEEEANRYRMLPGTAARLFTGLMYALGHGVLRDPKYPFLGRTLTNAAISDADRRAQRVHSKMMTYLDHVLEHMARE